MPVPRICCSSNRHNLHIPQTSRFARLSRFQTRSSTLSSGAAIWPLTSSLCRSPASSTRCYRSLIVFACFLRFFRVSFSLFSFLGRVGLCTSFELGCVCCRTKLSVEQHSLRTAILSPLCWPIHRGPVSPRWSMPDHVYDCAGFLFLFF